MVYYFLEGGAFMWPILLTLLFGLAFVIERAYSLMMSAVDSQTFFELPEFYHRQSLQLQLNL